MQIDILLSRETFLESKLKKGEITKEEYEKKFDKLLEQYKKLRGNDDD